MPLGTLTTEKSIENAIKEIRIWLEKIHISGLDIITQYDAKQNIALLRFKYKGKNYEFRSTNQNNCRLNMHAIARVMEAKVRAQIMNIENFEKSMSAYLMIEGRTESPAQAMPTNEMNYVKLGISPLASNQEIERRYKELAKNFHPDMAMGELAKKEFERRFQEINEAYAEIKRERGMN